MSQDEVVEVDVDYDVSAEWLLEQFDGFSSFIESVGAEELARYVKYERMHGRGRQCVRLSISVLDEPETSLRKLGLRFATIHEAVVLLFQHKELLFGKRTVIFGSLFEYDLAEEWGGYELYLRNTVLSYFAVVDYSGSKALLDVFDEELNSDQYYHYLFVTESV